MESLQFEMDDLNLEEHEGEEVQKVGEGGEVHGREEEMSMADKEIIDEEKRVCRHYKIKKLIQKGSFGKVYLAEHQGWDVAMKVLSKEDCASDLKKVRLVYSEATVLRNIEYPFIIELFAVFHTKNRIFLIMEYYPGGDLRTLMRKFETFPPGSIQFYFAEILMALKHLQSFGIAHRDLKLDNVILDHFGHIRLCDFGLAKQGMTKDFKTTTRCGTQLYMAPEIFKGSYSRLADIWSYGIMLVEMETGKFPFERGTREEVRDRILALTDNYQATELSGPIKDLVLQIIKPEEERIDVYGIMAHEYFSGIGWTAAERAELIPPYVPTPDDTVYDEPKLDPCGHFEGNDPFIDFNYCNSNFNAWHNQPDEPE